MRDRSSRRLFPAIAAVAVLVAACGSRGPLDVDVIQIVGNDDGGTTINPGTLDAGGGDDTTADANVPIDAPKDAPVEASLITCGTCVAQQCGTQILACLQDTTCRTALQCIATTCLAGGDGGGGGGLGNIGCLTNCAGGNIGSLGSLVGIFQCITQTCGAGCGGVLGGLGGIPGLGGGGGGGGGAGGMPFHGDAAGVLFSAFPEVCESKR